MAGHPVLEMMDSNYDRTELESALQTFSRAKTEWDNAEDHWVKTREEKVRVSNKMKELIKQDMSVEARKAAREKLKETSKPVFENENSARMNERKAYAVYMVASENVAKAGANLLFKAILDNQMQDTPLHYKKFKIFAKNVLNDEDLVLDTSRGLAVGYCMGAYGFNRADVCLTENEKMKFTAETVKPHHVATYDEIVAEVNRAALYADKVTKAVEALRKQEKDETAAYQTGARRLLPSMACTPVNLNYDFTRAAF